MTYKQCLIGISLSLSLAAASACSSTIDPDLQDSPEYSQGYADGCKSAHDQGNGLDNRVTRNGVLAEISEAYNAGWRVGHMACGGQAGSRWDDSRDRWHNQ